MLDEHGQRMKLRLLTRSATNAYFSAVAHRHLDPARHGDHLEQMIRKHFTVLIKAQSAEAIGYFRLANSGLDIDLQGYSDADVFERLAGIAAGSGQDAEANPRAREFDRLASGRRHDRREQRGLLALRRDPARCGMGYEPTVRDRPSFESVVAVHRLREVMSLYGFTRFEAPPTGADAELEDIRLATRAAPIGQDTDWLPAVEQFGEGIS